MTHPFHPSYRRLKEENEELRRALEKKRKLLSRDHPLIDYCRNTYGFKNDSALCKAAGIPPCMVSKVRHRNIPVTAGIMVKLHEALGITFATMRELLINETTEV